MPKNAAAAAKAKERKERKALELQIKNSKEKSDEGRAYLEPEGKAVPQFSKAINAFDAAIELYSENAEAFTYRATAYLEQRQPDQAIEDYTKALSLNPQSVLSLEGRASCYESLKQWDKAIMDYSTITQIQPENDHAWNMRGCCRLRKRPQGLRLKNADFAAVVEDFGTCLRLNENNYHAFTNLGKCYEEHSMFKKAIENYSKALTVKDEYTYAMFRRGCAALSFVEQEREKMESSKKLEIENLSVEQILSLEDDEEKSSKEIKELLKQAVSDFTRVIGEEKEKEMTAVVYRGTSFFYLKEYQRAEEDYNAVKKILSSGTDEVEGPVLSLPLLEVINIKTQAMQEEMASKK